MLTYRVDAEALGPDVFARVIADLAAVPTVAPAVDPNTLSKDEQRALIKAKMRRELGDAAKVRAIRGG